MVMGRFRGRSRISGSKYCFTAILLLKLSFPYTFLSVMFYSFNIQHKMGMFRFGGRVKGSYIYLHNGKREMIQISLLHVLR